MNLDTRNISDQLVDVIKERILTGAVPPDLPIRQDAMASELGISKIPLREALAKLEQLGLLVSYPNRGFVVRSMSAKEVEEIYSLRLKLEPDAVAVGAVAGADEDRHRAISALEALREAATHGADGGALNRAFHMTLIAPSGRPLEYDILKRLHILADRYVCKHLEPLGRKVRAQAEHEDILNAWLSGDGEKAALLTRRHIAATLEDLREQLGTSRLDCGS